MPLTNGSFFVIDLQEANKKPFFQSFSAYYSLKVHLLHFSKTKSQKELRSHKTVGIKVFLTIFAL
jgi:hypothetical protein